jgi:hypothetical protein
MWTDPGKWNVEIGAEAAQFLEKEYINGIAVAVLFYAKPVSKKCGSAVWCIPRNLGRQLSQYFGGFFHQIKVRQQIPC